MNDYVSISFSTEADARIAAGMLHQHDIDAIVESNNMSTLYGSGSTWAPVLLLIPRAQYPDAIQLLKSHGDI